MLETQPQLETLRPLETLSPVTTGGLRLLSVAFGGLQGRVAKLVTRYLRLVFLSSFFRNSTNMPSISDVL